MVMPMREDYQYNENFSGLITQYSEIIKMEQHPFPEICNYYYRQNFDSAYMLYKHTRDKSDKEISIKIIMDYIYYLIDSPEIIKQDIDELVKNIIKDECRDVDTSTRQEIESGIYEIYMKNKKLVTYDKIHSFCEQIDFEQDSINLCIAYNQKFIRYRFGGEYCNSKDPSIYFRISSTGFDWYDVIYDFVSKNKNRIQKVTIERDIDTDRMLQRYRGEKQFYYAKDKTPYMGMNIEEFLSEQHGKNPAFENIEVHSGVANSLMLASKGVSWIDIAKTYCCEGVLQSKTNIRYGFYYANNFERKNCYREIKCD